MLITIFSVIKVIALLTYIVMIILSIVLDREQSQEFFRKHKLIQITTGTLAILGGILFMVDVVSGKVI